MWLNGRQVSRRTDRSQVGCGGSGSAVGRDSTLETELRQGRKSKCLEEEGQLCVDRRKCWMMEIVLMRNETRGAA